MTDTTDQTPQIDPESKPPRRRRRLARRWKVAIGVVAALGAAALLVFVAPTHAARWLLASELEALGLEASGVETVEIDLWNREIWFGPLAIGPPGEEPARVERFGLTLSFAELFERRGLGERATIEGVVLDVRRAEDGRILLNGVDLVALAAGDGEAPAPDDGTRADGPGWGAGLNDFTLANSRVRFTGPDGGVAVLEVDRLALENFRTWTPQTPGSFSLDATLNDMGVAVEGTATPFADRIEVSARTELSAVAIEKVTRYTGSLGLTRGEGEMQARLDHQVAIEDDGAVALKTEGTAELDGLAVGLPEGPEIAFDRVQVEIDTDKRFSPDGGVTVAGALSVAGDAADVMLAEGGAATLDSARLALSDVDFARGADGTVTGGVALALTSSGGSLTLADRRIALDEASLDARLAEARIAPDGGLDLGIALDLALAGLAAEGPQAGAADRLALSLSDAEIARAAETGALEGAGALTLTVSAPRASLDGVEAALETLELSVADVAVTQTDGAMTLDGALALTLAAPTVDLAAQGETPALGVAAERLRLDPKPISLRLQEAAPVWSIDAAPALALDALTIDRGAQGDAPALAVALDRLTAELGALALRAPGGGDPVWSVEGGGAEATTLAVDLDPSATQGAPAARSIEAARLTLDGVALDAALTGAVEALTLEGVRVANRRGQQAQASLDRLHLEAAARRADADGGFASEIGRLALAGFDLSARADPALNAGLEGAEIAGLSLQEPAGGPRRLAIEDLTLTGADAALAGGEALEAAFDRLTLAGLDLTDAPAVGLQDGALAGLTAALDLGRLAGPPAGAGSETTGSAEPAADAAAPSTAQPAAAEAQSAALTAPAPIRIGAFRLADPARIAIEDTRMNPPVALDVAVERLSLQDFDSQSTTVEPAIDLAATVNEFTRLEVSGWAQPFGTAPRFELTGAVDQLQLPTFSAYAAKHLGVNLETGRLKATAEGGTDESVMDVRTQITIENLGFSPLSEADRERLSAAAGMPVETAVGLLENRDGVIELSIPIRGDLANPQFELDQVIGKAVANAVVGTITTTIKVLFPPALLISAVDMASSAAAGVDFAPAPFEPGETDLTEQATTLLTSLGDLLKRRPKLTVTVCGRATAADRTAILAPDVEAEINRRESRFETARAQWLREVEPYIRDGVVSRQGEILVESPPPSMPEKPAAPALDPAAVEADLAAERADELRTRLTDLAAERTRVARRDLAERQTVETDQVAECRPIFDPEDDGPPRVAVEL